MRINVDKSKYFHENTYLKDNRLDKKNQIAPLNSTVTFKGVFNPHLLTKIFPPKIQHVPKTLNAKAVKLLKRKSDNLAELYTGFRDTFIERIKTNEGFRNRLGISKDILEKINSDNEYIIAIPEENLAKKFISNIFAPLKIFSDIYSGVLNSKFGGWLAKKSNFVANLAQKNKDKATDLEILKNYKSYTGLLDSIKIWETKQRKLAGLSGWDGSKDLLTSTKVLESKAMRRWLKSVDPTKGKYQTKHQMLGNRLISGLVYGTFLGNDAYNTTIRYSDDKKEANSQRRSRFVQELAKIGINMYLINLLIGTFEKYVNKNLFHALFMASATTMTSEILGRKLVGRPIFPSDKETLDEMQKKMEQKRGFWVSVGRLLTGIKPKKHQPKADKKYFVLSEQRPAFTGLNNEIKTDKPATTQQLQQPRFGQKQGKNVSFGSFYKIPNYIEPQKISEILKLVEKADSKIYQTFLGIINKSLSNINPNKGLNEYISQKAMVPIGSKKTWYGNLTRSIISPYFFIKNTGKKLAQSLSSMFSKTSTAKTFEDMQADLQSLKKKHPDIQKEFDEFYEKVSNSKMWRASKLDEKTKKTKLLSEFLESFDKGKEEIEGVKNILLYLDKHLKTKEVTPENIKEVQKALFSNFMKTDGAAHVEYDGNTFAMMNINLSRMIATLFLVVDAFNLSMQYSNNDKNAAINNGKSRALQEASRITVSAYMLAFVHNLLSKFCNSSLFGAFTTTALTSSLNDSLARKAVGVPIGTKTHEELIEIDKNNAKSKSPLKRTLAYLIGKRQKPNTKNTQASEALDYSLSITKPFEAMLQNK